MYTLNEHGFRLGCSNFSLDVWTVIGRMDAFFRLNELAALISTWLNEFQLCWMNYGRIFGLVALIFPWLYELYCGCKLGVSIMQRHVCSQIFIWARTQGCGCRFDALAAAAKFTCLAAAASLMPIRTTSCIARDAAVLWFQCPIKCPFCQWIPTYAHHRQGNNFPSRITVILYQRFEN